MLQVMPSGIDLVMTSGLYYKKKKLPAEVASSTCTALVGHQATCSRSLEDCESHGLVSLCKAQSALVQNHYRPDYYQDAPSNCQGQVCLAFVLSNSLLKRKSLSQKLCIANMHYGIMQNIMTSWLGSTGSGVPSP